MNTRETHWSIASHSPADIDALVQGFGLTRAVAAAMLNRGITAENAEQYLCPTSAQLPDPFLLKNMDVAARRFADAILAKESIGCFLDYDSDGLHAGACIVWAGRMLGVEVRPFVPNRFEHGYGLNKEGLEQLRNEGITLVISVDCGISAVAEVEFCKEIGLDLLITDHHSVGGVIPDAVAVINPLLPGDQYPFKKLAGVGVAYMLVLATITELRNRGCFNNAFMEPIPEVLLPLVAAGTIADIVDLQGVNRQLVAMGLNRMRSGDHPFIGMSALCEVAGIKETEISSGQISYKYAPRCNASGRLQTAQTTLDLLLSTSYSEAKGLAEELDRLNSERQAEEKRVVELALEELANNPDLWDRKSIVLASPEYHAGVVGICCSRLIERYHRPTILISIGEDKAKGSCRSIKAFHMYNGLAACSEHLLGFGGHPMAAGLSLLPENIPAFAEAFESAVAGLTEDELCPTLALDADVDPDELTLSLCDEVGRLEPFGMANSRPVFCMTGCRVESFKVLKEKHLKLVVSKGGKRFDAIAFNMTELPGEQIDLAFTVEKNEWLGRVNLQLMVKGLREA